MLLFNQSIVNVVVLLAVILSNSAGAVMSSKGLSDGGLKQVCAINRLDIGPDPQHPENKTIVGQRISTGTLIDRTHVLASAHAFKPAPGTEMFIGVDCGFQSAIKQIPLNGVTPIRIAAKEVFVHQNYGNAPSADQAVVTLASEAFDPIPVSSFDPQKKYQSCILMGFGRDNNNQSGNLNTSPDFAQEIIFDLKSNLIVQTRDYIFTVAESDQLFPILDKISPENPLAYTAPSLKFLLDAGHLLFSSGPGDSGGPLLCRLTEKDPYSLVATLAQGAVTPKINGATKSIHELNISTVFIPIQLDKLTKKIDLIDPTSLNPNH